MTKDKKKGMKISLFRIIPVLLFTIMSIGNINAGRVLIAKDTITAREAFGKMPQTLIDLLPESTRLDMLDYFDTDSLAERPNLMRGMSKLITVTPDYLRVRITSVSDMQIKILPYKRNNIIMTIYTVGNEGDAQDSQINFYTEDFNEIPVSKLARLPELNDFINIPSGIKDMSVKEIESRLPFFTTLYEAYPGNDKVTARLTIGKYLSQESLDFVMPWLKDELQLEWSGKKLSLIK